MSAYWEWMDVLMLAVAIALAYCFRGATLLRNAPPQRMRISSFCFAAVAEHLMDFGPRLPALKALMMLDAQAKR